MENYNPLKNINPTFWLAMEEDERLSMVQKYVETEDHLNDSNLSIHATAHCVVENQIALDVKETVDALGRLRRQGLDRHDAIHAIASVLFGSITEALANEDKDIAIKYKSKLRKLSAKKWLKRKY